MCCLETMLKSVTVGFKIGPCWWENFPKISVRAPLLFHILEYNCSRSEVCAITNTKYYTSKKIQLHMHLHTYLLCNAQKLCKVRWRRYDAMRQRKQRHTIALSLWTTTAHWKPKDSWITGAVIILLSAVSF